MPTLTPAQRELLRSIANRALPRSAVDGRVLRPLLRHSLAVELAGDVSATTKGRALMDREASDEASRPGAGRLSPAQEDVLRMLLRQTGSVPAEHVDGRILRALLSRGLVEVVDDWVRPTDPARTALGPRKSVRRGRPSRELPRARAILAALDALEAALPRNLELMIQGTPTYADDLVAAMRRHARSM